MYKQKDFNQNSIGPQKINLIEYSRGSELQSIRSSPPKLNTVYSRNFNSKKNSTKGSFRKVNNFIYEIFDWFIN